MRHIFGLVIKDFHFSKEISNHLLTDYRMMVNWTKDFERRGEVCVFYIVAMNHDVTVKLRQLAQRFQEYGEVEYYFLTPDQRDYQKNMGLLPKQPQDLGGMYVLTLDNLSDSKEELEHFATTVGTSCLKTYLSRKEPNLKVVKNRHEIPAGLDIIYYGYL